jgi:hypothetical protein
LNSENQFASNTKSIVLSRGFDGVSLVNLIFIFLSTLPKTVLTKKMPEYNSFLERLIHENIHLKSYSKEGIQKKGEGDDYFFGNLKTGYESKGRDNYKPLFEGLNEAVVQKTTRDILDKHGISSGHLAYPAQIEIVDIIVKGLAEHEGKTNEEVWDELKRNQFTGKMMYLRNVEKVFGPGSLRVLASLTGDLLDHPFELKGEEFLYKEFFKTKSQKVRNILAKVILNKFDRKNYDNHREKMKDK